MRESVEEELKRRRGSALAISVGVPWLEILAVLYARSFSRSDCCHDGQTNRHRLEDCYGPATEFAML